MKELTCIRCPMGCVMSIEEKDGQFIVTGNTCPRGREYAVSEMTNPVRTLSVAVRVKGGDRGAVAVRVDGAVNKKYILPVADFARHMTLTAPVKEGQIIAENVLGSGANLIATAAVNGVER